MPDDVIAARLRLDGQNQFNSGTKKASEGVAGIGKTAEETGKQTQKSSGMTASGLLKAAAAAGATYKAYGWLKGSISTTTDLAKSTAALKRVTGLDEKQAQAWTVVTKSRGIQTKQLQMGMTAFGRSLGGLGGPTKTTDKALSQLGLTSAQLAALPMDLRMGMIADSFKAMPDGVNKAALAQKLFGKSGQALLPLLNSGAKGLNEQLDAANKMVPPLGASGKAALDLAKKQRELQLASTGLKVSVGSALIPIMSGLAVILVPIASGFAKLLTSCKPLTYIIIGLAIAITGVVVATKAWAIAQGVFNAVMAANPIFLVVLAIAALAAIFVVAYNKVTWFHNGVDAMANGAVAAFNWVKNAASAVFGWIKGNWPVLLTVLTGPFGLAVAIITGHFDKIKSAASSVVSSIKDMFGKIPGIIKSMFSGASGIAMDLGREIASWLNTNTVFGDEVNVGPVHFKIPALAAGGTMMHTGTALVGERGPELVTLPGGATVTPLPAAPSMGATITVPVYLDRRQIGLAVGEWNSDQAARKGKVA